MKQKMVPQTTEAGMPVMDLDTADISKAWLKEVDSLIAGFAFEPAPEVRNIRVPILSPPAPADVPGGDREPVYDPKVQDDIQGNIIPGFNKDHQHFLFYRIGKVPPCKAFLQWLVPLLSSMEEVLAFRRLFRSVRMKQGESATSLCATWVNIAFSHHAIRQLAGAADADAFGDASFRLGLAARSAYLGDPTTRKHPGHPAQWPFGGPKNEADIVIIIASDSSAMLDVEVRKIGERAEKAGLKLLCGQRGDTLPGPLRGHEHFGFKDGVSQPGIRGKLSDAPGDYITPRFIADTDPRRLYFARPGQLLAWPGQFLLGEPRQSTEDMGKADAPASCFPQWAARGSYLVVRRLQQDVRAFYRFVLAGAKATSTAVDKFAALMVGRWPSGAPLSRVPGADDPALGADGFANNHFLFDDDTRASELQVIPGYPGDSFPPAMADFLATVCPHFAHIRKVNPRDSATDLGKPQDNLARLILRRGIPYGPHVIGVRKRPKGLYEADRGLMFLGYGAGIQDGFEFLQRRWSNSVLQPGGGGHDPIMGQNGAATDRARHIDFLTAKGPVRLRFREEWVVPAGGGYFFAPAISAIQQVLGR